MRIRKVSLSLFICFLVALAGLLLGFTNWHGLQIDHQEIENRDKRMPATRINSPECPPDNFNASNPSKMNAILEKKPGNPYYSRTDQTKLNLTDAEWKRVLPADLFEVSRHKATERAFTGKFLDFDVRGTYYCAACGFRLFRSDAKFTTTCGWPGFFEQADAKSIEFHADHSFGMIRTEALCGRCGGHLGHLFDDGPLPTGKRYCMNGIALDFEPDGETAQPITTQKDSITLGGGCFWCMEAIFQNMKGVEKVVSGYSGGNVPDPTYREVCSGETGHAEVVKLVFDPQVTNITEILQVFFTLHDPTTLNRQGADVGTQYRSVIFCHDDVQMKIAGDLIAALNQAGVYDKRIVTQVVPSGPFYPAEDYHQEYYRLHRNEPYCRFVIQPKIEKFEKVFQQKK